MTVAKRNDRVRVVSWGSAKRYTGLEGTVRKVSPISGVVIVDLDHEPLATSPNWLEYKKVGVPFDPKLPGDSFEVIGKLMEEDDV